ncbi:penicillin-binding protein 2 [Gammaproteobacteria bacterium]|nr:penicillin-binding protein 2 [Gammaproteobacteria bacterium]MDB9790702.1 penicillin-binding protein 2 [Gammaproteobacteria bacterium]MDC0091539.1 penicillin-binding protein 2 [Gammaproteobacteria bacterium]
MKNNLALSWRAWVVYTTVFLIFLFVVVRIFAIQFNDRNFLEFKGNTLLLTSREIPVLRAGIFDRNNFPLAVSVKQYNLFALRNFSEEDFKAINVITPLARTFTEIDELKKKSLLFLNLDFSQYEEIKKLRLDSIEIEVVQKRYYPLGEQIAPLVGFAGKDGMGTDGLEKILNSQLSGVPGSEIVLRNASGKPAIETPSIPGQAYNLTIDSRIQFITFKHLSRFIEANNAKGGSAVVLDNHSGEILAIASYPSYNPNSPSRIIQRNRALVDAIEPGSIIKPLALAKGIDMGLISLKDQVDTNPGFITLSQIKISDPRNHGRLSFHEVIEKSSQVGASKLALLIGIEALNSGYQAFGLSKPPNILFPGVAYGAIKTRPNISDHEIASLGFGYNLEASALQLAQAYSVFANEGYLKDFKLFLNDEESYSQRVISKNSADQILLAMESVVLTGTGTLAAIPNHRVAGKTGTAHKSSSKGGYNKSKYVSSFAGIAPLDSKRLTIFVSVDEPGLNNYSGGVVAAPLFSAISADVVSYLDE